MKSWWQRAGWLYINSVCKFIPPPCFLTWLWIFGIILWHRWICAKGFPRLIQSPSLPPHASFLCMWFFHSHYPYCLYDYASVLDLCQGLSRPIQSLSRSSPCFLTFVCESFTSFLSVCIISPLCWTCAKASRCFSSITVMSSRISLHSSYLSATYIPTK